LRKTTISVVVGLVTLAIVVPMLLSGCGSQPMAVVNGVKITRAEFLQRLEETQGRQVMGDLILRALVEDSFAKVGLSLTDEDVNKEIEKAKATAPDENAWQQMLASKGIDEQQFRDFVAFRMKLEKLATKDVQYSEEKLKKFFDENKEAFAEPAMVDISEIVVAEKAEADKLYQELASKPDAFGDLARQHSISPFTRERGGRRGLMPLERVTPIALSGPVQNMNVGQVSKPISAEGNWYLIKVESRNEAKQPKYEDLKDQVQRAYGQKFAKSEQDLIDEMRKTAQVTIIDPKYQALNEFFRPEPTSLPTFGADEKGKQKAQPGGAENKGAQDTPATSNATPEGVPGQAKEAEKAYKEAATEQPDTR